MAKTPVNHNSMLSRLRGRAAVLLAILALSGSIVAFSRMQEPAQKPPTAAPIALPRGMKLCLKDGTFQIVRSYERKGDRVRYYSVERGSWEEIPDALVDWDATKKAEAASAKEQDALLTKVRAREAAEKIVPLDVDASLEVAKGVFLPPGEGMFVLEGDSIRPLGQVGAQIKLDKKRLVEQILVPVPVVPTRHRVQIPGARATLRTTSSQPEFYLREAPPDPDRASPIEKSSRPGMSGPEVELIRAAVNGNSRRIEFISTDIVGQHSAKRDTILLERWEVAKGVYRFTLGEQLPPGEYALAELLTEGLNLFVWDFGVDKPHPGSRTPGSKLPSKDSPRQAISKP